MKPIAKLTKRERAAILRDPNAKLSDLLEIAALDAIALQRQKRVKFDMSTFVERARRGSKCAVCLAGAVLFRDLDDRGDNAEFEGAVRNNCWRIDSARWGSTLYLPSETSKLIRENFSSRTERATFRVYLQAARKLREAGL